MQPSAHLAVKCWIASTRSLVEPMVQAEELPARSSRLLDYLPGLLESPLLL